MSRNLLLETNVQFVRGAGPARKRLLERLGISTVEDLLLHKPRAYLDRTRLSSIASLRPGDDAIVLGTLRQINSRRSRKGMMNLHALLTDDTGSVEVVWFNQPYLQRVLHDGLNIVATGPVRIFQRRQLMNPEFEILSEGLGPALTAGRIVPVYPLTAGLSQKVMRRLVRSALDAAVPEIRDPLPEPVAASVGLVPLPGAYEALHFPRSLEDARRARRRLAFDELFFLQLLLWLERDRFRRPRTARPLDSGRLLLAKARESLPFRLTTAQDRALAEVLADMAQDRPMNRLLEGDVGSGKTVVAVLAAVAAVEAGSQAAVMAPTEILAQQHGRTAAQVLDPLGIPWVLLLGRASVSEKRDARDGLASGRYRFAVGTHALVQSEIAFERLDLVVVDEQQRFGVLQRARLLGKGTTPHGLVMTATPIPRTLAMTLYGDLDLSVLDEKPPGRIPPKTRGVSVRRRDDLYGYLKKSIAEGSQVYFVCPLVEESEESDLKAATETSEGLRRHPSLSGVAIGLLHGRMKSQEKDRMMEGFRSGEIKILVTTTVVEVGVDVPNANIMIIEHPERYGLSQLHQLRGRVGRGRHPAHVFLLTGPAIGPDARLRLDALIRESDGFRIAEEDLRLRGPGDVFGVAQSGLPTLRVADLNEDADLVAAARREAQGWLGRHRSPSDPERRTLMDELTRRFRDRAALYRVG